MYGIRTKIFNTDTNVWEWRWAKGQDRAPLEFVTAAEAWTHKQEFFPGRSLAEVQVAPFLKEVV